MNAATCSGVSPDYNTWCSDVTKFDSIYVRNSSGRPRSILYGPCGRHVGGTVVLSLIDKSRVEFSDVTAPMYNDRKNNGVKSALDEQVCFIALSVL